MPESPEETDVDAAAMRAALASAGIAPAEVRDVRAAEGWVALVVGPPGSSR